MPEPTPSNVKIYERPERKAPSPILLVIGLLIVLLVGFFLYKAFYHPAPAGTTPPGSLRLSSAHWQERVLL